MKALIVLLIFIKINMAFCQDAPADEFSTDAIPEQKDIFFDKSSIIKSSKTRDPFKSPLPDKKPEGKAAYEKSTFKNGVFTNIPSLESITLDTVKVRGVLMGGKTRALISDKGNVNATIVAKEGDKINNGKVELKAILPRGVVFVEQITNVYGQFEYLETVVPISD